MENRIQIIWHIEKIEKEDLIKQVLMACFKEEGLLQSNIGISITLCEEEEIKQINGKYRNIEEKTDVLSFPMFEKSEINYLLNQKAQSIPEVLGDIVICIPQVEKQAEEFGHSFERELAYMLVHGFYHLMGYDHIKEEDKKKMRPKEEKILERLQILR